MAGSPSRGKLYRRVAVTVILAALGLLPLALPAQRSVTDKRPQGPRALALVQLAPNGKAYLIPITILIDGKYYDATAYKADPVPMALDSQTVYEGFRDGVSQGLFTVTAALQQKDRWIGDGVWQAAGSAPKLKKSTTPSSPRPDSDTPPRLRRTPAPAAAPPPADTTTSQPSSGSGQSAGSSTTAAVPALPRYRSRRYRGGIGGHGGRGGRKTPRFQSSLLVEGDGSND